jgi:diguanylate cyclase (GGDEF)-like protein
MPRSSFRPDGSTRWALWTLPRPVLVVILSVEVIAVAVPVRAAASGIAGLPADWLWRVGVILAAGIISTECSLGVERLRHRAEGGPHIDLSSVWAFAAAALLPAFPACVVVMVIYAHIYLRIERSVGVPPHRVLFSAATIVLAVCSAAGVMSHSPGDDPYRSGPGLVTVVLAVLAYAAVNMILIVSVIWLSGDDHTAARFLQLLRGGDEFVLEFATLSMGALVAGAMASFGLAYAVLVLPPLIVLHRTVLVRQLEVAASTDSKTGLLNAAAWHLQAGRELRRAERCGERAAVLVLDLDHFKRVNDEHGHLVGDSVLAAVATAVRAEVRDDDLVGRFGGEEFVVLLRGVDDDRSRAEAVAERIRRRVARLDVEVPAPHGAVVVKDFTVSIGGAVFPPDGLDLARLLETADAAMYQAKSGGRNRVRMGAAPARPHPTF